MAKTEDSSQHRRVRIYTGKGAFDGTIRLSLLARTLDELNSSSRNFLVLDWPASADGDGTLIASQLAVNKSSILFALELDMLDSVPPEHRAGAEKNRITQSVLRLSVSGCTIEGNVHVLPNGSALSRMVLPGHPFVAFTAATIVGPGFEIKAPFLAVNRTHVLSAHESCRFDAVMVEEPSPLEPTRARR